MTKLSIQLVQAHLTEEAEGAKAKYDTMKAPDGKSKEVGKPKDKSGKMTKIKQIDVPTSHKGKTGKKTAKGASGIPQADRADQIIDRQTNSLSTKGKTKGENSPATPAVKKTKPNQTTKQSEVKNTIKRTESGKGPKADTIPAAKMASEYTSKMPHGNHNLKVEDGKTPTVDPAKPASLNGTTAPARSAAKMKTHGKDSQKVAQVNFGGSKAPKAPSDAPAKPSWSKNIKGHNVMESVQFVINGKPKSTFGVIHADVAAKLVESYEGFGFDVEVQKAPAAAWKADRELMAGIFEAVDAHYNNAPSTSRRTRKAAMNRFFQLSATDFNNMYESKQHFAQTLKAAFERIMEQADIKYRQKLNVMEGVARVQVGEDVMDLEMITQARDTQMALRNIRNEIVEEYGFNAQIKHIFLEGEKFRAGDIADWTPKS